MTNIDILVITIHVSVPGGTGKMSGLARQTLKKYEWRYYFNEQD